MTTTTEQVQSYAGPAVLSYGFRPFFLAGAVWAVVAVVLWLLMLTGRLSLPSAMSPLDWHAHELIYGYVPAVIAGFLLTAIPNWTGRLPVTGTPLLILFLIWLCGRVAVFNSALIGVTLSAVVDLAFLAALGVVIAREIIAGKNARNLKVLAVVGIMLVGNTAFHIEVAYGIGDSLGLRIGIASTIFLISLIGGRIIPSFTRNWLERENPGRLPTPFNRFDIGVISISGLALASWVISPDPNLTALTSMAAGLANLARLSRWAGERTATEPLVVVLHIAFAFVPVGFLLLALSIWRPDILVSSGALHAWTTGAIGLMTLAVMTRASLGHAGRALTATLPITLIYIMAATAVITRLLAAFNVSRDMMLHASAGAWVLAFSVFVIVYAPMLLRQKP